MKVSKLYIGFGVLLIALGWTLNNAYDDYKTQRDYNGLFLKDISKRQAIETSTSFDRNGDWVCINSRFMTYDECVETAQHECGHEVFAEIIEKNPEKIKEVMELVQGE